MIRKFNKLIQILQNILLLFTYLNINFFFYTMLRSSIN